MGQPLFSEAEIKDWQSRTDIKQKTWEQTEFARKQFSAERARRAQQRPTDFLAGLIIAVGTKGKVCIDDPFASSNTIDFNNLFAQNNTPEVRRSLYTLLRALTEIPKSWAGSAFCRFLRGTGKQKNAKYHGAGMFGVQFGWIEREVDLICRILMDELSPYSQVLMRHDDSIRDEIRKADPDYEVSPIVSDYIATRIEYDIPFLTTLCNMLETRGLAQPPSPAERKPPKARVARVFKPGDVVRKSTIRDLPPLSHVRIKIEKRQRGQTAWISGNYIELVVCKLLRGEFSYWFVVDGKAYTKCNRLGTIDKIYLEGAVFLGVWKHKPIQNHELKINYNIRVNGNYF